MDLELNEKYKDFACLPQYLWTYVQILAHIECVKAFPFQKATHGCQQNVSEFNSIQLHPDTVYLDIASETTDKGSGPKITFHF